MTGFCGGSVAQLEAADLNSFTNLDPHMYVYIYIHTLGKSVIMYTHTCTCPYPFLFICGVHVLYTVRTHIPRR